MKVVNIDHIIFKPGARLVSWNRFHENVGMRVCVCVRPQAIKNYSREMKPE